MTVPENFSGFRVRIGSRRDEVVVTVVPIVTVAPRRNLFFGEMIRYIWPDPQQCADFVREAIEEKIAREDPNAPRCGACNNIAERCTCGVW